MDRGQIAHAGPPAEIFGGDIDLYALNLEVPAIPRLIQLLRSQGMDIPAGVLKVDELVNILC
jgi:energy-coupling factor transport system ATP-binding protein